MITCRAYRLISSALSSSAGSTSGGSGAARSIDRLVDVGRHDTSLPGQRPRVGQTPVQTVRLLHHDRRQPAPAPGAVDTCPRPSRWPTSWLTRYSRYVAMSPP